MLKKKQHYPKCPPPHRLAPPVKCNFRKIFAMFSDKKKIGLFCTPLSMPLSAATETERKRGEVHLIMGPLFPALLLLRPCIYILIMPPLPSEFLNTQLGPHKPGADAEISKGRRVHHLTTQRGGAVHPMLAGGLGSQASQS